MCVAGHLSPPIPKLLWGRVCYCMHKEQRLPFVYAIVLNVYFDKKLLGGSSYFLQLGKLAYMNFALTPSSMKIIKEISYVV